MSNMIITERYTENSSMTLLPLAKLAGSLARLARLMGNLLLFTIWMLAPVTKQPVFGEIRYHLGATGNLVLTININILFRRLSIKKYTR